jgi:C4-dicarboxylate-specific signal transduction histidine kinase
VRNANRDDLQQFLNQHHEIRVMEKRNELTKKEQHRIDMYSSYQRYLKERDHNLV